MYAYNFESNQVPGQSEGSPNVYWRDVGTLDAYFDANMDLKRVVPDFDVYRREWPVNTVGSSAGPAKFVHDTEGRIGEARQSIVGAGTIISGALMRDCIVGRGVRVHSYGQVEDSIVMDGVTVHRGCRVKRAIIDKDVELPAGSEIGYDADEDRARGWTVTDSGITVVPKRPTVRPVTLIDLS